MPRNNKRDPDGTDECIGRQKFQTVHDWGDDPPLSTTILKAISSVIDKPVADLPPLFDTIDPDALDVIFRPASSDCPRNEGELTFPLEEVLVTVQASGEVEIVLPDSNRSE